MIDIFLIKNNTLVQVPFKDFTFNGGEVSIKLEYLSKFSLDHDKLIVARINSSDDFMKLAMVKNALGQFGNYKIHLVLPYVPYARQDRICDRGESFSLKVFSDLLNSLNFDSVLIFDPHSDVCPALINNVQTISQLEIIQSYSDLLNFAKNCILISPDSGANKKTAGIAKFFERENFIRADKLRDLSNGKIKETIVYCDDFFRKDVIVFDDICDGGATFIELAKVCKKKNCGKFYLYVTHGIFSRGIPYLLENQIDGVFSTNSFKIIDNLQFDIMKLVKNHYLVN